MRLTDCGAEQSVNGAELDVQEDRNTQLISFDSTWSTSTLIADHLRVAQRSPSNLIC